MATTTNYGWTTPDNTALVKDGAAAIRTLGSSVDSTLKTQIDNTVAAAIPKTIVDAKGDLIAATAADTVARLAVGTNNQVLMADSSTATGLKWDTPATGAIVLISETTASALSSLTLGSIPQTYKQIILTWNGIVHNASGSGFQMRFNNNSGNIYYTSRMSASASSFNNSVGANNAADNDVDYAVFGINTGSAVGAGGYARGYLIIDNYASTTRFKTFRMDWGFQSSVAGARSATTTGTFATTTAVSSIDIFRGFGSGTFSNETNTSIRLYGVL